MLGREQSAAGTCGSAASLSSLALLLGSEDDDDDRSSVIFIPSRRRCCSRKPSPPLPHPIVVVVVPALNVARWRRASETKEEDLRMIDVAPDAADNDIAIVIIGFLHDDIADVI